MQTVKLRLPLYSVVLKCNSYGIHSLSWYSVRTQYRHPPEGCGGTIDGVVIQCETHSFKTFTSSLNELKEWLLSNGVTHVAMESTSV